MATFSSVTRQHILRAIEEHDDRGAEAFVGVYGYTPAPGHSFVHEGRSYDSKAVLGVAHRYATGRPAVAEELVDGKVDAVAILRRCGFEATAPASARAVAAPRRATPPRRRAAAPARRQAAPEPVVAVCPTCFMTLPATGVCDSCG